MALLGHRMKDTCNGVFIIRRCVLTLVTQTVDKWRLLINESLIRELIARGTDNETYTQWSGLCLRVSRPCLCFLQPFVVMQDMARLHNWSNYHCLIRIWNLVCYFRANLPIQPGRSGGQCRWSDQETGSWWHHEGQTHFLPQQRQLSINIRLVQHKAPSGSVVWRCHSAHVHFCFEHQSVNFLLLKAETNICTWHVHTCRATRSNKKEFSHA